jgi:acetyl esterase/lipase
MKTVRILFASLATLAMLAPAAPAQGEKKQPSKPALEPLWPDGAPGAKGTSAADVPGVVIYLPPKDKANGAAVVICPGGGYQHLAIDYEGYDVAAWLNTHGVAGIVLRYRLGPKYHHPTQLHDAQRAIRFTRSHGKDWGIDPGRVGILGFSAGGHLASTAGTHFDRGLVDAKDPIDRLSSRPDFMILMYPVITLEGPYAHGGSRNNVLGKDAGAQLIQNLSNDKQVTADTPPTFLVHTSEDSGVPPENSVLFYLALHKNKVPAELHIYEKGRHGLGLGPSGLPYASWPERCIAWMQSRALLAGDTNSK